MVRKGELIINTDTKVFHNLSRDKSGTTITITLQRGMIKIIVVTRRNSK